MMSEYSLSFGYSPGDPKSRSSALQLDILNTSQLRNQIESIISML